MSFLEDIYDNAMQNLDNLNSKGLESFSSFNILDERYSHFQEVNRGGLKKIISAHDEVTDRPVAIAFLKKKNPLLESRFVHEARLNAKLQHPNIIPVYDICYDDERGPFFTMKLIEGKSLGQILTLLRKRDQSTVTSYPQSEMVEIFRKICDAVYYAHNCGVIHLDLKPENIQLGRFGEVLVCDWGMAKVLDEECDEEFISVSSEGLVNITLYGEIKGTPGYMAPEQIKNQRKDQRTDIYALGCILYSLLTWQQPIEGRDLEAILSNTVNGNFQIPIERKPAREIPESLNAVVMKCMEQSPSKRYQSVNEIIDEVDRYSRGFSTHALEAGFNKQLILLYRRNSKICKIVLTSLIFLTFIIIFFVSNLKRERNIALSAQIHAEQSEQNARVIAQNLQKEKELKSKYLEKALKNIANRIVSTWERGDHLKLVGEVKEMINNCFALELGNKQGIYNQGHIAIVELDFKKAFKKYTEVKDYDSLTMAKFCQQQIAPFSTDKEISISELIRLSHDLIKLNKAFIHRILSRRMIEESKDFKRTFELVEKYSQMENKYVKNFSLKENYNEKTGILSLRNFKNLRFRIISLFDIKGLDLSGSHIRLYQYREKSIHYSYLNLKDTNINGLPFSGEKLEVLYLNSGTKWLNFLVNCPVLKELHIPKGKFTKQEILKYCKSRPQIIEY